MAEFGILIVWVALQVTVVCGVALVLEWLLARRCPRAAVQVLVGAFAALAVLTFAAFLPVPDWWNWRAAPESPVTEAVAELEQRADASVHAALRPGAGDIPLSRLVDLVRQMPRVPDPPVQRRAWQILSAAYLAGLGLSAAGMLFGLMQVSLLRRRSVAIVEPGLQEMAVTLARQMGCRGAELRQADVSGLPATVGFRRPLILLPPDWPAWSDTERRAVLAHELAHICGRDYLTNLFARVGAALHFYHPLSRWLVSRLRLRQELAADAVAAGFAGGRETYLRALARLALRPQTRCPDVPARLLLSAHGGVLFRRVQMLRITEEARPLSCWARRAAYGVLLVTGLAASGLRLPAQAPMADTKPPAADLEPFDLAYLSHDGTPNVHALIAVRPSLLLTQPGMTKFRQGIRAELENLLRRQGRSWPAEFALEDIDQFVADVHFVSDGSGKPGSRSLMLGTQSFMIHTKSDMNWEKTLRAFFPKLEVKERDGKPCYCIPAGEFGPKGIWLYAPNPRTLAAAGLMDEKLKLPAPQVGAKPRDLGPGWKQVERATVAVAFDNRDGYWTKQAVDIKEAPPIAAVLSQARSICVAGHVRGGIRGEVFVEGKDEAAARKCQQALEGIWSLIRASAKSARADGKVTDENRVWLRLGEELLNSGGVTTTGKQVHAQGTSTVRVVDLAPKIEAKVEKK